MNESLTTTSTRRLVTTPPHAALKGMKGVTVSLANNASADSVALKCVMKS